MFSFFQNTVGALLGILLALFFIAYITDNGFFDSVNLTLEDAATLEDMFPAGSPVDTKLLIGVMENLDTDDSSSEKIEESVATEHEQTTKSLIDSDLPDTQGKPRETQNSKKESVAEQPVEEITPALSGSVLNTLARAAVVNIFCKTKSGDAASGSGVVIDDRGIILTNAHIAQYFLLDTFKGVDFITCNIRTGSPAKNTHKGELLYLSSQWIEEHADEINKNNPRGTGENDYALIRIIPSENKNTEATSTPIFKTLKPAYGGKGIDKEEPILLASYPAGFLGSESINKNLWLISSFSSIKEIYRFSESSVVPVDIFSIHGTIGTQEGSSGGAIVNTQNGELLGLAVTRSAGVTTEERDLFVLTLQYINTDIKADLQKTLEEFLMSDVGAYQEWFNANVRPRLKERLVEGIER